jgi:ABC-type nitrate/sulfonate/bicarbonate transport system permease component
MYTILKSRHGPRPDAGVKTFRISRNLPKPAKYFFYLLGFLVLGVLWQLTGYIRASPALPSLKGILRTGLYLLTDKAFIRHITASLKIIFCGIGMAAAVGFIVGVLIFRYKRIRQALLPVIECVRGISALTLFPLLIVLFGLGMFSRVFVIFWTAWPAIILSTLQSLDVDSDIVAAARTVGAGEWRIILNIRLPMALQGIMIGIRIGASGGWISLIAAEMLGASKGIGFYLLWSSQAFQFEKVYASIFIIAAIGGLMNMSLLLVQKQLCQITGGSQ